MDFTLLKEMVRIHAPAGDEAAMTNFILDYVNKNKETWKVSPTIYAGDGFQDSIVLVFGKPRTAIFAHLDSIGFTVRYGKQLVKIGGPRAENGYRLVGDDSKGAIECTLHVDEEKNLSYEFEREIDRGTGLTFKPVWREDDDFIQCCYMDNRLGIYSALKVAETLTDGIICFSCWEESGGGAAEYLGKFMFEKYNVKQALICDITWVTEGVHAGKGVAISLRDTGLPRKSYVNKIRTIATESKIEHQLEVEAAGGSDGNALQRIPYPIDWCFVGAPEDNVHTPDEKVHKNDVRTMIDLYKVLMERM